MIPPLFLKHIGEGDRRGNFSCNLVYCQVRLGLIGYWVAASISTVDLGPGVRQWEKTLPTSMFLIY